MRFSPKKKGKNHSCFLQIKEKPRLTISPTSLSSKRLSPRIYLEGCVSLSLSLSPPFFNPPSLSLSLQNCPLMLVSLYSSSSPWPKPVLPDEPWTPSLSNPSTKPYEPVTASYCALQIPQSPPTWREWRRSSRTAEAPTLGFTSGGITGRRSRSAAGGSSMDRRSCFCPITTTCRVLIRSKESVQCTASRDIRSSTQLETTTTSAVSSIIRPLELSIPIEWPCTVSVRCPTTLMI